MPKKTIKPVLPEANGEKCFWVSDGAVLKNLKDLSLALKKMSQKTFAYHSNKLKNDFASWVDSSLSNPSLAEKIKKSRTKESCQKKVDAELKKFKV
jgi:hypothetical protein